MQSKPNCQFLQFKPFLITISSLLIFSPLLATAKTNSNASALTQLQQQVAQQQKQMRILDRKLSMILASKSNNAGSSNSAGVKIARSGPYLPYSQLFNEQYLSNNKDKAASPSLNNLIAAHSEGSMALDYVNINHTNQEMGNGVKMRRLRLGTAGFVTNNWAYNVSIGYGGSALKVRNAFMRYFATNHYFATIGQFKQPFSLERRRPASLDETFMERSLATNLADNRDLGAGINYFGNLGNTNHFTAELGAFGQAIGDNYTTDDQSSALTGRLTDIIMPQQNMYALLGVAATRQNPTNGHSVRYRARPETKLTNVRFVDTGTINNVDHINKYDIQAAGIYHNFSVQGEYLNSSVLRQDNAATLQFSGWYAYASWFITGETRTINTKTAIFNSVVPSHQYGAWELAVRYSDLNLNSHDVQGGKERNVTYAANWYLNKYVELMANYVTVHAKKAGTTSNPNIVQLRMQIGF